MLHRPGDQRKEIELFAKNAKRRVLYVLGSASRIRSSQNRLEYLIFHWSAGARDGLRQWTYPMAAFLYHIGVAEIKTQYFIVKFLVLCPLIDL
jgi:hypothetical protein